MRNATLVLVAATLCVGPLRAEAGRHIGVKVDLSKAPSADLKQVILKWEDGRTPDAATVLARVAVESLHERVPIFLFCVDGANGCQPDYSLTIAVEMTKGDRLAALKFSLKGKDDGAAGSISPSGELQLPEYTPGAWMEPNWWAESIRRWADQYAVPDLFSKIFIAVPVRAKAGHFSIPEAKVSDWRVGRSRPVAIVSVHMANSAKTYWFRACAENLGTGEDSVVGGDAHQSSTDVTKEIPCEVSKSNKLRVTGSANGIYLVDIRKR